MMESIATTWSKCPKPLSSMSPLRNSTKCATSAGILSRAKSTKVGDKSMATTSAPRRAASTAKAPVPQPASKMRLPLRS